MAPDAEGVDQEAVNGPPVGVVNEVLKVSDWKVPEVKPVDTNDTKLATESPLLFATQNRTSVVELNFIDSRFLLVPFSMYTYIVVLK